MAEDLHYLLEKHYLGLSRGYLLSEDQGLTAGTTRTCQKTP
ncbi:hypothetical protein ACFFHM_10120 [Halalkalibacter kiskunsagensis]|uniref:Uncharacterized protein n=1 Tax=Halalkalibacter kiskunsagensis TaxID=1548599 RepID=A0ABV6KCR2_9BACI